MSDFAYLKELLFVVCFSNVEFECDSKDEMNYIQYHACMAGWMHVTENSSAQLTLTNCYIITGVFIYPLLCLTSLISYILRYLTLKTFFLHCQFG